ncbi:AraC family transcriptional regulator [Oceanirhabdus seepicola]|uniref:AraC family transcriptional regulator n=1 Tax=Oceanirhabdus seepicola TaxID=2828781 RepID=A0A9J6NXG7_9CLOT|nr:helix-turn-helix domain-containing protein [Oceanirhabdus seepicola]MCM1988593.1 AraC family transcriptional regulator [Oceanirhabdus seepicola]
MFFEIDLNIIPKVRYIGHVTYNFPWIHFERVIDEFILYIIESGEMYIEEDDKKHHLLPGDCFLLEPNKLHRGYKEACCSYYFIHFKHSSLTKSSLNKNNICDYLLEARTNSLSSDIFSESISTSYSSYYPKMFTIKNETLLSEISSILTSAIDYYNSKLEHYKLTSSIKLLEVLILIIREFISDEKNLSINKSPKSSYLTNSLLNYLNRKYLIKITSELIEKEFELNYDYMNRVFKKNTGFTIKNYVNVVRINKAKEILATTSCKVREAGYLVGIDNPYYFSRLFKQITGTSPLKYIKSLNIK